MIYTTNMLLEKYAAFANPFDKIKRECSASKLYKLKRGLYEDNPAIGNHLRGQYLYGPSYLSFEYVLSMYGIIPEYAPNVTCATFGKNRSKIYDTPFGLYIYRDVPKSVFPLYVEPKLENGYSYIIALPEKALCDKLYISNQVHNMADFKALLFDDLRIDKHAFANLDFTIISEIAPKYKSSNTNLLLKCILGGKVNE